MKEIPLTQGKVALVDDEDYERLMAMGKWHVSGKGGSYAARVLLLGKKDGKWIRNCLLMHRFIMDAPSELQVDHINGDKLDNRRFNLRLCTSSENSMNRSNLIGYSSEFKGVSWSKKAKKWKAYIKIGGILLHLGYFTCPIEAAKAYNEAAIKYHGEFAKLNPL